MLGELAYIVDLLDAIWTELNLGGEEFDTLILVQWAVDEGALYHALLTLGSLQQALREARTGHSHRKCSRSITIFGLDYLITTKLNAADKGIELLASDVAMTGLRDQRHNGDARVSTNNGDVLVGWIGSLNLGHKSGGTDDIEGSDTE